MERRILFDLPSQPLESYSILYELDPVLFSLLADHYVEDIVLEATKSIYGLGDAPLLWRLRLEDSLKAYGFVRSNWDECMYVHRNEKTKRIDCAITVHIDDLEVTGEGKVLKKLRAYLEGIYGPMKEQTGTSKHCGTEYNQTKDLRQVSHNQENFVREIPFAPVPPKGRPKGSPCNTPEHRTYRSGTGACIWSLRTRLDAAAEVPILQSAAAAPTLEDLFQLNKVVKKLHDSASQRLVFNHLSGANLRLLVLHDASFQSRTDPKSRTQLGLLILLIHDADESVGPAVQILHWGSKKSDRATKSTLNAECVGQTLGIEEGLRIAGWLHELSSDKPLSVKELRDLQMKNGFMYPIDCGTDAKSLYDCIGAFKEPCPSDCGSILWLRWIREQYEYRCVRGLGWFSNQDMLADVLTKPGSPLVETLRSVMEKGVWEPRFSSIMNGLVMEPHKGLPAPKSQKNQEAVNFRKRVEYGLFCCGDGVEIFYSLIWRSAHCHWA